MIFAIVPAAGRSRRMGTPKQLLPFGSSTVIGHVVDQLLQSSVDGIWVVVGHEFQKVATALSGKPVHIVQNPDYRHGEMLSSVRCALRALPENCEAVLTALGDQPSITPEVVDRLTVAFRSEGKGIIVPAHGGRRGHPVLVANRYRGEILTRFDDAGLRGLLAAHGEDVFELSVPTADMLFDIDDPEDYLRACS